MPDGTLTIENTTNPARQIVRQRELELLDKLLLNIAELENLYHKKATDIATRLANGAQTEVGVMTWDRETMRPSAIEQQPAA